jgi:uncharacterized membrane protein
MTQEHPVVARYMASFEHGLKDFDFPGHDEVVGEIRQHIADASAAGKPLDAILQSLGPADVLARAYAVELLLRRRPSRRLQAITGFAKVTGLIAAGSFVTFVVVGLLGTMGIGFGASGVAIITIGALEQAGIHLPGVEMAGVPPALAIALGLLVLAIGAVSLIALRQYMRFVIRTLKSLRPLGRGVPGVGQSQTNAGTQ